MDQVLDVVKAEQSRVAREEADALLAETRSAMRRRGDDETVKRWASAFAQVIASHPRRPDAWYGLVDCFLIGVERGAPVTVDELEQANGWIRKGHEAELGAKGAAPFRARLHWLAGDKEGALRHAERAGAGSWHAAVVKAAIAMDGRDFEDAIEEWTQAFRLAPPGRRPEILVPLSKALLELERSEEAVVALDEALAIDPGLAHVHHERALCLWAAGRLDDAREAVEKAVEVDDREESRALLRQLTLATRE